MGSGEVCWKMGFNLEGSMALGLAGFGSGGRGGEFSNWVIAHWSSGRRRRTSWSALCLL